MPSKQTKLRTCLQCGQGFQARSKAQRYCSLSCVGAARVTQVTLVCQHCGKAYTRAQSAAARSRFCSNTCHYAFVHPKPTLICQHCQKPYQCRRGREAQSKFCSTVCSNLALRRRVERTCEQCGQTFSVPPSNIHYRFCSKACSDQYRRRFLVRLECEWCGKEYVVQRTRTDSRYCSSACQHAALNKRVEMICDACGKTFTTPRWSEGRTRYCSRACKDQAMYNSVELQCQTCGSTYTVQAHRITVSRFCSQKCRVLNQGETSLEREVRESLTALGLLFVTQHEIGRYFLDFYLPDHQLAVEADGEFWHDAEHDAKRDAFVLTHGIRTVRITYLELHKAVDKTALVAARLEPYLTSGK